MVLSDRFIKRVEKENLGPTAEEVAKLALWNVVEQREDVFCSPGAYEHIKKSVEYEIELAALMLAPRTECTACLMGQDASKGEGTHLEGTRQHPKDKP